MGGEVLEKPFYKKWWFFLFLAIFILGIIASQSDSDEEEAPPPVASEAPATETKPADAKPKETKKPEAPKKEEKPKTTVDVAKEIAGKQFDSVKQVSFNEDTGNLFIKAVGADNLTKKMVRDGIKISIMSVLEKMSTDPKIKNVSFNIMLPLVDAYGNTEDSSVVKADFKKATIDKINFENFSFKNVSVVADSYWEHPAVRE